MSRAAAVVLAALTIAPAARGGELQDDLKARRARVLFVTPAGEQLLEQIEPFELAVQRLILEPLARSERTEFMRLVRKLVELNNEHSRVPLRVQAPAPAKRKSASARRKTAAPAR